MTDKEKILAEIERLKKEKEHCPFPEDDYTRGGYNGYYLALDKVLLFLCELPEEPVSDTQSPVIFYGLTGSVGSPKEEPVSDNLDDYINELSKQFPEVSFAKLSRIAVRVSRWQRNQDTKHKLPEVKNRTDIDEYAYQCAYDMSNDWMIENPTWHDVEMACKLGAKWQKEQDKETIELAEDHAMLAGMEKMKEEMIAKSIEAVVSQVPCSNEIILYNPSSVDKYNLPQEMNKLGLNKGDKVKVIVIKED